MPLFPSKRDSIRTVTGTATTTIANDTVLCNSASDFTLTLLSASGIAGFYQTIKNINTGVVTIDGNGVETIEGNATLKLYIQNDTVILMSDGTNWIIVDKIFTPHSCSLRRAAAQSISNNTTTKIAFDTIDYDNGGLGDVTTNDRIDIQRTGLYSIEAMVSVTVDDTEVVLMEVKQDGSAVILRDRHYAPSTSFTVCQDSEVLEFSAGTYLELQVYHNQGGSQNTETGALEPRLTVTEIQ